ncbi:NAD(+) diphosphatase [Dactylosporangium sp. NPDC000555]|uniref:NAD(+) diphosphatase n=1 Tax=Dactylosporangium sp. NPDC000555 TaxID=3154260 RepID=UPI003322A30E
MTAVRPSADASRDRPGPPLARGPLDRAAHRRNDEAWLSAAWDRSRVVVVDDGHVLVRPGDPPELVLLDPADAPAGERFFLGEEDGTVYFAVAADTVPIDGTSRVNLRQVGHALSDLPAGLFITAVALANWHSRHPYSPLSGKLTVAAQGGWVRMTEDGGETLWPRTDPAVIMLVHDGVTGPDGRCLLGFNAQWKALGATVPRFSTLAGFVEPGESAEMAVAREVLEEVGVRVGDVSYVASQPWPFPGSLMLGFHALAPAGAAITVDVEEIAEARWLTRTEIAAVLDGESQEFGLPFPASIAHYLITEWLHA